MSLKARSMEALVGATLGTGAGALAGRLSYKPDFPLEWTDEEGAVRARRLDPEERSARRSAMANAALMGAGVGMAASLGGSLFRRSALSKAERQGAKDLGNTYLDRLRQIISEDQARYHALSQTPGSTGTQTAKEMRKRIDAAQGLLRKEEKAVTDLLDEASSRRAAKPFGGRTWSTRKGERVPFYEGSHRDLVKKHFDQLAKQQGFKGFSIKNRRAIFDSAIDQGIKKTAAEAYRRELYVILEAA